jgi:hypothetical protein
MASFFLKIHEIFQAHILHLHLLRNLYQHPIPFHDTPGISAAGLPVSK